MGSYLEVLPEVAEEKDLIPSISPIIKNEISDELSENFESLNLLESSLSLSTPTTNEPIFFGLNKNYNKDDPNFLIDKNKCINILRNDIFDGMTLELKNTEILKYKYSSLPVLYTWFDVLHKITYGMEDGSIIMNRNTLLTLALDFNSGFKIFPIKKIINGKEKTFIVLHPSSNSWNSSENRTRFSKLVSAASFEESLFNGDNEHITFSCIKKVFENTNIYYTSQIDLFENGDPLEAKSLEMRENQIEVGKTAAVKTVTQCKLGGVKNVIVGFVNNQNQAVVKKYTVAELDGGKTKIEVSKALARMKIDLAFILKEYKEKWNGNSVKIIKCRLKPGYCYKFEKDA